MNAAQRSEKRQHNKRILDRNRLIQFYVKAHTMSFRKQTEERKLWQKQSISRYTNPQSCFTASNEPLRRSNWYTLKHALLDTVDMMKGKTYKQLILRACTTDCSMTHILWIRCSWFLSQTYKYLRPQFSVREWCGKPSLARVTGCIQNISIQQMRVWT